MENLRSNRAVQREDVWAAADALLLEGKRPTIERVRQTIGRGSPNTVSPMLEEWFATLGPRMAQLKASGGVVIAASDDSSQQAGQGAAAIPPALAKAMQAVWQGALEQAQQAAQAQLASEREQLAAEQAQQAEAQQALEQAEALMEQQRASLEQALAVAHAQIKMQSARLADLEQAGRQKDQFFPSSNSACKLWNKSFLPRAKQQMAAQAQQHRALQEVDRARQEVKQWMAAQRTEQEKLAKLEGEWQAERRSMQVQLEEGTQQLNQVQTDAAQLRQSMLMAAEQHAQRLALNEQQHSAQMAQLQWQIDQLQERLHAAATPSQAVGEQNAQRLAPPARAQTPARAGRSPAQMARAALQRGAALSRAKR